MTRREPASVARSALTTAAATAGQHLDSFNYFLNVGIKRIVSANKKARSTTMTRLLPPPGYALLLCEGVLRDLLPQAQ